MPSKWTRKERAEKRKEIVQFYIKENKTIKEVGKILNIAESTVFDRMKRLNIKSQPSKKLHYRNIQYYVTPPKHYSNELAEFIGIMLGDGHISHFQIMVTLGTKEYEYVEYVSKLMNRIFNTQSRIHTRKDGQRIVYVGSVEAVKWLENMGLTHNKVEYQVDVPKWIYTKTSYMQNTIRGLIDTNGSIYKLKFGTQISFCNHSYPLLRSARAILVRLGFHPSQISGYNLYLTKRCDLLKFFKEIGFNNTKHRKRSVDFARSIFKN